MAQIEQMAPFFLYSSPEVVAATETSCSCKYIFQALYGSSTGFRKKYGFFQFVPQLGGCILFATPPPPEEYVIFLRNNFYETAFAL